MFGEMRNIIITFAIVISILIRDEILNFKSTIRI